MATPRPPAAEGAASDAAADHAVAHAPEAERVVRALADSVRLAPPTDGSAPSAAAGQDARPVAEVMRLGWGAGNAAFAAGHSVHHVWRDADLLLAVVLAEVERVLAAVPPGPGAGAADGVVLARRLQRAAGRYAQSAVSGFLHALLRGLRDRYRTLRHDLRNPLGTIRSALSLMEDETLPLETRQGPGIRAMVARNAGSLDRLIGRRLDDASAAALLTPSYAVDVRGAALAARREVRDVARLVGCEVAVDVPESARSHVDGAALERTLTAVLLAALARGAPGDQITVRCAESAPPPPDGAAAPGSTCVVLEVRHAGADGGPPRWDADGLALALALAHDHGGRLGLDVDAELVTDTEALVAALAAAPAVYLRLPFVEPGAEGADAFGRPADASAGPAPSSAETVARRAAERSALGGAAG